MKERERHLPDNVCRHHWSRQITMKVGKLLELSASTVTFYSSLMKATVLAESSNNLSTFIVICLLERCLQTVVAIFPSF